MPKCLHHYAPLLLGILQLLALPTFLCSNADGPTYEVGFCLPSCAPDLILLITLPLSLIDCTLQMVGGAEVLWQKPANPRGVLFVAHGCNHGEQGCGRGWGTVDAWRGAWAS